MNRKKPFMQPAAIALIVLSCIWGYNWVVMKECLKYAGPFDFAALRSIIGAVSLLIVMIWMRKPLRPQEIMKTIILGFFTTTGCVGLVAWSLDTGAVGKTAILVYFMPFWVLVTAWPLLGERIRGLQWAAVVLAFAGLVVILEPWNLHGSLKSKLLAILSGVAWGASALYAKVIHKRVKFDLLSLTTWQMFFGSLPLLVVAFLTPSRPIEWTNYFIVGTVYSSVISQAAALLLWFYILQKLPAGIASMGTLATPVIGIIAAAIELGERPTMIEAGGMTMILTGLSLLSLYTISLHWKVKPAPPEK
jgi:drug/metabolite transporter (DMT)-like permease